MRLSAKDRRSRLVAIRDMGQISDNNNSWTQKYLCEIHLYYIQYFMALYL